jgi:hypothetical protein
MYLNYLIAVVRRALQPTVRITDGLQILAASAAPAIADAAHLPVPDTNSVLAYIGAAAIAFVALRLFFVAPYQVWRDQAGEIGGLKLELSKPERLEMEHLSKWRAASRMKLATAIREFHWASYHRGFTAEQKRKLSKRMMRLHAKLAEAEVMAVSIGRLFGLCNKADELPETDENLEEWRAIQFTARQLSQDVQLYLHGKITAEALALRLPPSIAPKTPL